MGIGGAGAPVPLPPWRVFGQTDSTYIVLESHTYACVDSQVTLRAQNQNGTPVASNWSINEENGITPDPTSTDWQNTASITFSAANPREYNVTGVSVADNNFTDSATVTVLKVDITDDAGNPITTELTRSVGQKISLKAKVEPTGLVGLNYQWTISGTVVKNYEIAADEKTAQKTDLSATDKQGSSIQFYWVDGANDRDIKLEVTYASTTCDDTISVDVERPTMSSFTSTTGPIDVGSPWGGLELYCGTPANNGLNYSATVVGSASFGGQIKFTQILKADLQSTKTDNSTTSWKVPAWWLDVDDPYAGHGPYALSAATSLTKGDNDSPGFPLEVGYKKANNKFMRFELYLMFKPTVAGDAIWVPLGELSWGWTGIAESTDGGNTWSKTSGAHDTANPSGASTVGFPEWSDKKSNTNPTWQSP